MEIRIDGHRLLGAAIGTTEFKEAYVKQKVTNWVKDIQHLAAIAEEPQVSLSAYTKGICHQ